MPSTADRRELLFERTCLAFLVALPLFYLASYLQEEPERVYIAFGMATGMALIAVSGWALSRRGRMDLGVDLFGIAGCVAIVGGSSLAGTTQAGPVVWLLTLIVVLASLHRTLQRGLLLYVLVTGTFLYEWVTLEPLHPSQFPVLGGLLLVVGTITRAATQVSQEAHAAVFAANSSLRAANDSLRVERNRAQAADLAKTRFLAMMSHELRTPLNAIQGYTGMLREALEDGPIEGEEADADLRRVETAADVLLRHVARILEVARLDGEAEEPEPVQLGDLLETLATQARPAAEQKGLVLSVHDRTAAIPVLVRRDALRAILADLLDNAVRFTEAGTVRLEATQEPEHVVISVVDTGIGVEAADQDRVFELFTQADGSYTRAVDGVGLGLPLCRRLADAMGATLSMDSTPGVGTTMRLRLPTG